MSVKLRDIECISWSLCAKFGVGQFSSTHTQSSVIFVNDNENENGEKRENNELVNEN